MRGPVERCSVLRHVDALARHALLGDATLHDHAHGSEIRTLVAVGSEIDVSPLASRKIGVVRYSVDRCLAGLRERPHVADGTRFLSSTILRTWSDAAEGFSVHQSTVRN